MIYSCERPLVILYLREHDAVPRNSPRLSRSVERNKIDPKLILKEVLHFVRARRTAASCDLRSSMSSIQTQKLKFTMMKSKSNELKREFNKNIN